MNYCQLYCSYNTYRPIAADVPCHQVMWLLPSWCTTWGHVYKKMYWIDFQLLFLREPLTCIQWNYNMLSSSTQVLVWATAYFDSKSLKDRKTENGALQQLLVQTAIGEYTKMAVGCVSIYGNIREFPVLWHNCNGSICEYALSCHTFLVMIINFADTIRLK